MNYKAYDRLQRRKYWRDMDKLELVSGIILWSLLVGFIILCWRYGNYTATQALM